MPASVFHAGGTQWHVLSAAVHQTHIWDEHVVHNSVRCEMLLYAVETVTRPIGIAQVFMP